MDYDKFLYCSICSSKIYRLYYMGEDDNIICPKCRQKIKADYRNKNLDPDSSVGIGYVTEILVSKFLGISTCFEVTDNFHYPKYDLLEHEDWGKIDVKGSTYHPYQKSWVFRNRHNKKPDFFFCIGYDINRKHVECVYYIPNELDIIQKDVISISIYTWRYDPYIWFKQDPKPYDDLFHNLRLDDCPVLRRVL